MTKYKALNPNEKKIIELCLSVYIVDGAWFRSKLAQQILSSIDMVQESDYFFGIGWVAFFASTFCKDKGISNTKLSCLLA